MAKANLEQLPPALFDRLDDSPDTQFYQDPRFVAHIDEKTIGALSDFYRVILLGQRGFMWVNSEVARV